MRTFFRISALAAMALGATALTAQAQGAKSFGLLAGVDFATLSGDDVDGETSSRTGFIGGLYANMPVGSSVSIEPEVLYVMKGAEFSDFGFHITNSYIEIPVLIRYDFKPDGGPYLLAGPAIGFSISCKESDGDTDIDCSDDGLEDNTTFGGVIGLGFQKNRFGLEGRYDFDFGDAWKDVAAKNAVWEIMLRIAFSSK